MQMTRSNRSIGKQKRKAREFAKALSSSCYELDKVKAKLIQSQFECRQLRQELEKSLEDVRRLQSGR